METVWRYALKTAYIIFGRDLVKMIKVQRERCRHLKKKTVDVHMGPISKYSVMIASHNRATVNVWLQHTQVTAHNHSFSHSSDSRVIEKQTKTNRGRGGPSMMYVSFFLKKC